MLLKRDNDICAPIINDLSLRNTSAIFAEMERLIQAGHRPAVAVSIVFDAALMCSISILTTAVNNELCVLSVPLSEAVHGRIDDLLKMETRVHDRFADGSVDPNGQRRN